MRIRTCAGRSVFRLVCAVSAAGIGVAASADWARVRAKMAVGRDAHAAMVVGRRVLIVGGRTRPTGRTTPTTTWFDPARRTIAPGPAMAAARSFFPLVRLADGRLLVPGGYRSGGGSVDDAEILDARASRWSGLPPMTANRELHTATLLDDGGVLIVGGFSNDWILRSTERFVPATGRFVAAPALWHARFGHTASRLSDGRVFIAGGRSFNDVSLASCEIYDPHTGNWNIGPSMHADRFRHTATTLSDGRILLCGGFSSASNRTLDTAEIYDPATGRFTALASPLRDGRMDHTATLLPDGRVLITGGWSSAKARTLASAEVFDPASLQFDPIGHLPVSRHEHVCIAMPDGTVAVIGGLQWEPDRQRTLNTVDTIGAPPFVVR